MCNSNFTCIFVKHPERGSLSSCISQWVSHCLGDTGTCLHRNLIVSSFYPLRGPVKGIWKPTSWKAIEYILRVVNTFILSWFFWCFMKEEILAFNGDGHLTVLDKGEGNWQVFLFCLFKLLWPFNVLMRTSRLILSYSNCFHHPCRLQGRYEGHSWHTPVYLFLPWPFPPFHLHFPKHDLRLQLPNSQNLWS